MLIEQFITAFDVWEKAHPYPYTDLIFDQREIQLVVTMQGQAMTADQVAGRLDITPGEATEPLKQAYRPPFSSAPGCACRMIWARSSAGR